MAIKSPDEIKSYFKTGAKPTEEHFSNLIDTLISVGEQTFLQKATPGDARLGQNNELYMTPYLTKEAINALSSLMNAPTLKAEVQNEIQTAIDTLQSTLTAITDQLSVDVSTKEDKFTKNTAFNKNFGTGSDQVARGSNLITTEKSGMTASWSANIILDSNEDVKFKIGAETNYGKRRLWMQLYNGSSWGDKYYFSHDDDSANKPSLTFTNKRVETYDYHTDHDPSHGYQGLVLSGNRVITGIEKYNHANSWWLTERITSYEIKIV